MNLYTKKKMFSIVSDLIDGTKSLKEEKVDGISTVWVENLGFFQLLIEMLSGHLAGFGEEYQNLLDIIASYCATVEELKNHAIVTKKERNTYCKTMNKQLEKLHYEIKRKVPDDKKELVFFPYLFAMWDSLESVWKAAVDSGEYEVYVVPIPYFERNSDGSLGKMFYDGGEYPEEVQIVSWESYQIADRKPDVVYIHNPYDGNNHVTSIHPDYYIENLKKHAGSVVYIPYFVGMNDVVEEHFCVNPVTVHADKIIVQSENVQNIYIDTLTKYAKDQGVHWSKEYLQQKVLALGSPKYDKARVGLTSEIPKEWKEQLYCTDGTKKKVIFYNTTLGTVLKFDTKAMDKIEDTLLSFREQADNITLLWRPHPLMESTLKSMRPQLYRRYFGLLNQYRTEKWGILDESKDFARAVAVSDAYYGDPSSVVDVFEKAGKPIMVRNVEVLYQKEYMAEEEGK